MDDLNTFPVKNVTHIKKNKGIALWFPYCYPLVLEKKNHLKKWQHIDEPIK